MKMRNLLKSLAAASAFFPTLSSAALLGVIAGQPVLDFGGDGMISYDAASGTVTISGDPQTLIQDSPFIFGEVMGTGVDNIKDITVTFKVDSAGHLVSGTGALTVMGSIDVDFDGIPDYDGVLLTADVTAFGFEDGGAGSDQFDLRMNNIGGALAPVYADVATNLAMQVTSEVSAEFPNPFSGSFASDFVAQAKGVVGSTDGGVVAGDCDIGVDAYCSVKGGPQMQKCRIKVSKSPCHWEHESKSYHGHSCNRNKYGMHGDTEPSWVKKYPGTDVTFTYVVTNTGTTAISNLSVDDSFDTALTGVPATLNPGQSATITRIITLREGLTDVVTVMGEYGTAMCSANDNVVITDKMKDMKLHDLDRYKGKW